MAATVFATPQNNCSTTIGSAGYTAGAGNLVLAAGGGTLLPPLSGGNYCRATVIRAATAYVPNAPASTYTIFRVTAISGDNLTLGGTLEGTTDRNYAAGDVVEIRVTKGTLTDIQGAVNTVETTTAPLLIAAAGLLQNDGAGNLSWLGDPLAPLAAPTIALTANTTMTSGNFGRTHLCSGTGANFTVTLPPVAGNGGKFLQIRMAPGLTKLVTILRNGSDLIDGATSRVMWANEIATLFCDGVNWTKIGGKTLPMTCVMYRATNFSVAHGGSPTIPLDTTAVDNTGQMADPSVNFRVNVVRPSLYVVTGILTWIISVSVQTTSHSYIVKTGGNIAVQSMYMINGNWVANMAASVACAAGDSFTLAVYQASNAATAQSVQGNSTSTAIQVGEIPSW